MAGVSDKARYHLEQAIPQLRDFEQKAIFDKEEIRKLVKKRSDFEHKILARGSKPIDFARYAAWEMNLERLRAKRCKRFKITTSFAHAGQARIFSIFDRATRKHPGDLGLWMSYLDFARQVEATSKFRTILTSAIRLHCTNPSLWLYAAQWSLEAEADMSAARSYMQRGIRFCTKSKELWIGYAKLEMLYLTKVRTRRQILGIDGQSTMVSAAKAVIEESKDPSFEISEDMIDVPDLRVLSNSDPLPESEDLAKQFAHDPLTTPALNGAIPLAIFDNAKKQPFYNSSVAEQFFDMFSAFRGIAVLPQIIQHVVDSMMEQFPTDATTWSCFTKQPTVGVSPLSAEFPTALVQSLERRKTSMGTVNNIPRFSESIRKWMDSILKLPGLDAGIAQVLRFQLRKLQENGS